jgi:crossover junction endodeoxyribonuclease RuvC
VSRVILGIDPGLTRLGYGLISQSDVRNVTFVSVGVFRTDSTSSIEQRVGKLSVDLETLIDENKPDSIAIERVFAQANLKSVMGVAQISGVVLAMAYRKGIPIAFHTPSEVKASVTGSGRADKSQVGFMVAKILNLPEVPKPADAADSLAIAICHAWNSSTSNLDANPSTPAQKAWHDAVAKAKRTNG